MISSADSFRGQQRARELLAGYLSKGRLSGTFLLMGQRGLGKSTLATIIARALTCEANREAPRLWFCGECYACRTIAAGDQPEFVRVLPRGQDIATGQIDEDHRGFRAALMHPAHLSHRVFVLEEAHHLNVKSGNQLLKVFEEAPERTVFILTTDRPDELLPTIHSRAQKLSLLPIPQAELAGYVAEDSGTDSATAGEAAQLAAGIYVDAIALAQDAGWREAVKQLAAAIYRRGSRLSGLAAELAGFEFNLRWQCDLCARELSEDEAARLIKRAKSDEEKGLKARRNTLTREALITAYDRAAWWALKEHGEPPHPRFLKELAELKLRIAGNIDANLAQAAFELGR